MMLVRRLLCSEDLEDTLSQHLSEVLFLGDCSVCSALEALRLYRVPGLRQSE